MSRLRGGGGGGGLSCCRVFNDDGTVVRRSYRVDTVNNEKFTGEVRRRSSKKLL
jgi:hypothetical protein